MSAAHCAVDIDLLDLTLSSTNFKPPVATDAKK
jgi:hypothetical protein